MKDFTKTKKTDILSMLLKCEADLAAANAVNSKNTKIIEFLEKCNNELAEATKAARGTAKRQRFMQMAWKNPLVKQQRS
jgi:hypothetical protein